MQPDEFTGKSISTVVVVNLVDGIFKGVGRVKVGRSMGESWEYAETISKSDDKDINKVYGVIAQDFSKFFEGLTDEKFLPFMETEEEGD